MGTNDFADYYTQHNFMLWPSTKVTGLFFDNRIRMAQERRIALLSFLTHAADTSPDLRLHVRRDHLIRDAVDSLDTFARFAPDDLKKRLFVEFDGEQGIDEGGVSKEFFSLIIDQIFNPDYGMFMYNEESRTCWFNPSALEPEQFMLVGLLLGLAIYNSAILDLHFPLVLYHKLCGKLGVFQDLAESHPTIYKSVKNILEYEGADIVETFSITFEINCKDVFGNTFSHDLLPPEGAETFVNQSNKHQFADLYADFLLNKSVAQQFNAFRRGFHLVAIETPIEFWMRPRELEELICGSKSYDFEALENQTVYDGYTATSSVIRWFWQIVHEKLNETERRQLLQFITGSDRVPVGGLGKMKLFITRQGPDTDKLPCAQTCFNVLLLPEYSTPERLEERLRLAISYAKGFGAL